MSDKATRSMQSLHETLSLFQSDWQDLLSNECNPLDIALPMVEQNGALNIQDFKDLKYQFTKNLQRAVNANYMAFNDSIGSYGISIETLNQSQDRLGNIRECLDSVNSTLNSKSNILGELNSKKMEYGQIINIMKEINDVQKKLSNLQDYIENREFEKSVNLINEIREISIDNRLSKIEGLQSLHTRLETSITLLVDALVDEIEGYIYSKNTSNINSENVIVSNRIPVNKGLLGFIKRINGKVVGEDEDLEIQNSKYDELYEKFLLVKRLNKESECLSRLVENSEREIKKIINRSVNEVRNKFSSQIEMNLSLGLHEKKNPFYSFNLLQGLNGVIIKEIFEKIFNGVLYLVQRHVAIYEISKINGYKYKIGDILKEVQKQLSLIIFNYVIDENLLNDLEELDLKSKHRKNKSPFDKLPKQFEGAEHGPMFQFSKLSINSLTDDLVDSLNNIFVSQTQGSGSAELNFQNKLDGTIFIGVDDINESKKNILVPPSIFNMAYLIDEFIDCTHDLITIYPSDDYHQGINPVRIFFDQFMDVVFISQLDNTLIYQFDKLCEHKWKQDQLLDASISFERFFNRVLILLDTALYYRPSYVHIIFKLIYKIDEKFREVQESVVNTNKSKLLMAWIHDSKLKMTSNDIVRTLLNNEQSEVNTAKLGALQSTELSYALAIGGQLITSMNPNNFMTLERMQSLVDLLASLSNILSWLPNMKRKSPKLLVDVDLSQKLKGIWTLSIFNDSEFPLSVVNLDKDNDKQLKMSNIEENNDDSNNIYLNNNNFENELQGFLSLDENSGREFDKLVHNLEDLMNDVEILIRYEIRVECIWCMIQMMLSKQWEQSGDESVDLGVDKFCERVNNISRTLNRISKNIMDKSKDEIRIRIFGGLGFWIDKLVIFESRRIEVMGQNGWMKMIVNLRVLQQVIKVIDSDYETNYESGKRIMNDSLKYFTLGMEGEKFIMSMERIRSEGLILNDDDWKNLIRLVYSEKMKKEVGGNVNKKYMAAQARLLKSIAPTKKVTSA